VQECPLLSTQDQQLQAGLQTAHMLCSCRCHPWPVAAFESGVGCCGRHTCLPSAEYTLTSAFSLMLHVL